MKKSARILHVLIGCASAALLSSPASAQTVEPELQFYPATKWGVSASDKLCTINTSFNNGFGFRVVGNEKWVRALDIDFKQDIFTAGESYDASLTIPGVRTKSYKASAQTGSLLAFSMDDKEFYKAMKQSGVVDLKLDDNAFRFYLTGFGNSVREFENCMAGASAPKTAAQDTGSENFMVNEAIDMEESFREEQTAEAPVIQEITPEPPTAVIQEIPYSETKKVGDYTVSASDTQAPVRPAKGTRLSEQLAKQIADDPSLIDVDDSAILEQRKKLQIPQEIAEMPIVPEEETAVTPMIDPAEPPSQEILLEPTEPMATAAIEEESAPMPEPVEETLAEAEPEDMGADAEVEVETVKVVENVENYIPVEETEATRVYTKTKPMTVHKETMSAEADFTHVNDSELSTMNSDLRKDVISLEATVRELKAENEALNAELKKAIRESEEERLTIASENWNLEQATMKFNEAERQNKRLGQQLQKERAQCSLEKRELESMLFDPQVTEQAQLAKLSVLEGELKDAKRELEAQRLRYEERIRLLESTQ